MRRALSVAPQGASRINFLGDSSPAASSDELLIAHPRKDSVERA